MGLTAAWLALPGCSSRLQSVIGAGARKGRPNVLFIAIDDLNDWAHCLGGYKGEIFTPNLDRLAARGVLFTNAHCAAPACNPSRASIMTGMRPSTSGIYYNSPHWRVSPVLKDAVTIPEHFKSHGYSVVGGGKIFHALSWINRNNENASDGYNDAKCWDEYYPSKIKAMPRALWPKEVPVAKGDIGRRPPWFFDWAALDEPDSKMADYKVADWAIGELQEEHNKPFFQAVGIFRPHIPWYVPCKYFDLYPLDKIVLPRVREDWKKYLPPAGQNMGSVRRQWHRWVVENKEWKKAVQGYLASVSFADAQLGRVLDCFDASGYANNTIIVLWSDHGFHLGERETWEKFTLWEESTRVTFIMVVPELTKPGAWCGRPVSLLDIYPTLIELCGLKGKPELEGQSLMPLLRDPNAPRKEPAITTYGPNNHTVRTERWRYIRYVNGDEELYDHKNDPDEYTNLADKKKYEPIKKKLAVWLPTVNVPNCREPERLSKEQIQKYKYIKEKIDWQVERGDWELKESKLAQTSLKDGCRIFAPQARWDDYIYEVKARKTGGVEGFLILFRAKDGKIIYKAIS